MKWPPSSLAATPRGLTYQELSEATGISRSTLSWWSWRLRRDRQLFAELEADDEAESSSELRAADSAREIRICIGDLAVLIPVGFDADTLRRTLAIVEDRC